MAATTTALKAVDRFAAVEKKERIHRHKDHYEDDFADVLSNSKKKNKNRKKLTADKPPAYPADGDALFQLMFQAENLNEPFEDASRIYTSSSRKAGEKIDIVR